MSRRMCKLTKRQVETLPDGFHSDGGNLYLLVKNSGQSRSWVFRYSKRGKVEERGLQSTKLRTLAQARVVAHDLRIAISNNKPIEPIINPNHDLDITVTFKDCAKQLIEHKSPEWKNKKHLQQWQNTMRDYVYPFIGNLHPSEVDVQLVVRILKPIWSIKTETATRVRQRVEAVLDYASVQGYRNDNNPARWRGKLDKILPKASKIAKVTHFPAMAYKELPTCMDTLLDDDCMSSLCLRFIILTAARSGEARGARWSEIDMEKKVWTIPPERMKAHKTHRIPLSLSACNLLQSVPVYRDSDLVFNNRNCDELSSTAISKCLKQHYPGITVHGMRSSFRQWVEETTNTQRSVSEFALAHVNKNTVEAAYQRSDLLDKRKTLMQQWDDFICNTAKYEQSGNNIILLK